MCGICGVFDFSRRTVAERPVQRMMKRMKHRGPDDDGIFLDGPVGFGHVRLSIIDLSSAGHQPMVSQDGRFVLVFNGEIYNYIELREELEPFVPFRTRTDTEVLLNAFIHWGPDCLHRFNGMFAFAVYDRQEGTVFLARDRFGIKPLYYYRDDERLVFASDIPPILEVVSGARKADDHTIFEYLVFNRTDQTERTFFQDIKKLQHGHCMTIGTDGVSIRQWYNLRENIREPFQSTEEFRATLSSAIALRLRSDVPVGVCLSGGLDSSSIVSILLHDYHRDDINTFSAVYGNGVEGDESEFINEYSGQLEHMHRVHPTADTFYYDLFDYTRAHSEPTPTTGPYAQFMVMQLAKDHVAVTLDGQGADEQLAGYHYFYGYHFKDLFKSFKWPTLFREILSYSREHQSLYGLKTFLFFMLPPGLRTKLRAGEGNFLTPDFYNTHAADSVISGDLYDAPSLREALLAHFEYKLEHLLKWEDRNSMFFSLEARVPFLDHRLVERLLPMPGERHIKDGVTKAFLREAMEGTLPEKIRNRKDKTGFVTPQSQWFRNERFKVFIGSTICSDSIARRGYVKPEAVCRLMQMHDTGKEDFSRDIWKLVNLELWFRNYVD
jgi:asparagine synthase (glutamine-hydrolysing)